MKEDIGFLSEPRMQQFCDERCHDTRANVCVCVSSQMTLEPVGRFLMKTAMKTTQLRDHSSSNTLNPNVECFYKYRVNL